MGNNEEGGELLNLGESKIVWLEDIAKIDYVRERQTDCPTRRAGQPFRKGHYPNLLLVGYSELLPDKKKNPGAAGFTRRVFTLRPHDRCYGQGAKELIYKTGAPVAGVDPRTVKPNVAGIKTDRSEGEET